MELILNLIGGFLIWNSIYFNRNEESEIKIYSKDWWFIFISITVSFILFKIKL
jgi:hypothetical protein